MLNAFGVNTIPDNTKESVYIVCSNWISYLHLQRKHILKENYVSQIAQNVCGIFAHDHFMPISANILFGYHCWNTQTYLICAHLHIRKQHDLKQLSWILIDLQRNQPDKRFIHSIHSSSFPSVCSLRQSNCEIWAKEIWRFKHLVKNSKIQEFSPVCNVLS